MKIIYIHRRWGGRGEEERIERTITRSLFLSFIFLLFYIIIIICNENIVKKNLRNTELKLAISILHSFFSFLIFRLLKN
jgi:Na+-driven multidrug efflux pump